MRPISTTEMPALDFSLENSSREYLSQSNKIGWIRAQADKQNATFDLAIKDALGRTMAQRQNCKVGSVEFGELINLPTMLGEKINVEVTNIQGADKVTVFVN